ncbi:MAG: PKD domain-containing protein, partial [Acidobacteria bacterium]
PLVGTQDDGGPYGATSDALNIWDLLVKWRSTPIASLTFASQLPVAAFDSIFPCAPTSRDCLPQPGIVNPAQYLDILSYRQRPTFRLAYRNFKSYEALVTNQSVEALPGAAGVRWYEIRRTGSTYSVYQQGTYAPNDGVHRWMGSIAQDKKGDMGLGYSVVNGVNVYPGIRYTGRLSGDPLGQMTQGEGTIIDGTGVQTITNSRWGDYSDMTVDPTDDCTFWYVNEYYTAAGQASSPAGWQTRIGSFKLPSCQ